MSETSTAQEQLDTLDGESLDVVDQRLQAIKALLPEAFDLDGNLVRDKLIEALKPASYEQSDDIPAFGLAWPGKQQAFSVAGVPTTATLRPCQDQSVDFDTTRNLLIEGDNLEVLKTLQRSYHGKVKMIYIDPPYNTGKDFVYPDNYGEGLDTYLQRTQQKDEDGFWTSTNSETSGRKHANWLSMMAPRLTLARNLLRSDGVIFISIDDNEAANLRMLCDEVFGAENFRANISWQKKYSVSNNFKGIASIRDFVLVYAKSQTFENGLLPRSEEAANRYQNPDGDMRGPWKPVDYWNVATVDRRPNLVYPIVNPNTGKTIVPTDKAWKYSKETHEEHETDGRIWWGINGDNEVPALKLFLTEVRDGLIPHNWWIHQEAGHTDQAKKHLNVLFGGTSPFETPKPVKLIRRIMTVAGLEEGDIVLDFFAGSGTTGHAVMAQNAEDGGNRRYICVQLPEPLDEPVTLDDGIVCETIFDLTRERLKRAGKKIKEEAGLNAEKLDTGLRVFKLDSSNFTAWNSDPTKNETDLLDRLEQLADHTVPGRTEIDILWEVLLKMGLPLDLQLERFEVEGAVFIGVAERTRVISTQAAIPTAAMEALLNLDVPPSELVVLDSAFADDTAKANIATLYRERKDEDGKPICNLKVV